MTEWWSYSLRDLLMFSPHTYYRLFELYNIELWPLQLIALALGGSVFLLWRHRSDMAARAIAAILALCWLWVAWAYHWQRYATISLAADYYALAFALEALLLLWLGVLRGRLTFAPAGSVRQRFGLLLFLLALLCFPLIGPLQGRSWLQAEIFGVAPDPTALATLGILLFSGVRPVWWLFPIPAIWCLVSGATLWALDAPDFMITPLLALLTIDLMIVNGSLKHRTSTH
ncbi:MAG TPA: DUF6064 family protein [Gallionellaceae bacterium]|nr:DUF6064 family protein [Gallionellaceae bacterium]